MQPQPVGGAADDVSHWAIASYLGDFSSVLALHGLAQVEPRGVYDQVQLVPDGLAVHDVDVPQDVVVVSDGAARALSATELREREASENRLALQVGFGPDLLPVVQLADGHYFVVGHVRRSELEGVVVAVGLGGR